jgi:transcriptional regulator with XRE-family HTH domain
MKTLGEKIQEAREFSAISQRKLGLLLGISDKTVSSYENGRTRPSVEILSRISKELKKPIGFFLDESLVTTDDKILIVKSKVEDLKKEIAELEKKVNKLEN